MIKKVLFLLLFISSFYHLHAQKIEVDTTMWVTNGTVRAIAKTGNTIYLGGGFSYIGPNTGGGAILDINEGKLQEKPFLRINGKVLISIPDGKGGWYIGGTFTEVQGISRNGLAHILPDGFINKHWNPNPDQESSIKTLALSGNAVYIGGRFEIIGGQSRRNLAAVDATTGLATSWRPDADSTVNSIIFTGNTVYAGGSFNFIGGQNKNNLAALDIITGLSTSWNPDPNGQIMVLAVSGDLVYIGGQFESIGGQSRRNLAAVEVATGLATPWTPDPSGPVLDMAVSQHTIYVAGMFTFIGGQNRNLLAAIDENSGLTTPWNPNPLGSVNSIAISGNSVFIGGGFASIGGQNIRRNMAVVDAVTGLAAPWHTDTNDAVWSLAVSGNTLFAGGEFTSAGGVIRNNLVAIDAATGQPSSWNPNLNSEVKAMASTENTVYVGGHFNSVNGQTREGLAAIDATTGIPTSWNPRVNGIIYTLVLSGSILYIGGNFSTIGGQNRLGLAAVNTSTGHLTSWNPTADNNYTHLTRIAALFRSGNTVYVGGDFNTIGVHTRNHLAAIDAVTGQVTSWNPDAGETGSEWQVSALAISSNIVYVGGRFTTIGGQNRQHLAAVDVVTGQLTSWKPVLESENANYTEVNALSVSNNVVYVGGFFNSINGQKRNSLASIDAASGQLTFWNPDLKGYVFSMAFGGNNLYVGGSFTKLAGRNISQFAVFRTSQPKQFIKGIIYNDTNGNCHKNPEEESIAGRVVLAQPGNYFTSTDAEGNYTLAVDKGSYTVEQVIPQEKTAFIKQVCPNEPYYHTVQVSNTNTTISGIDFANQISYQSVLSVEVSSDRRRRCFSSTTRVSYQNSGNKAAQDVKVYVKLPEYVVLVSANVPFTQDAQHNYVFSIGSLAADSYGSIQIKDSVVCNNSSIRGLTQCTKAWITPANSTTPSAGWDGSDISLTAKCMENGRVRLALLNKGAGNMADSSSFRIFLDASLVFTHNFKLTKGDSLILQVPANGQTLRLEAEQRPFHPTKQQSNITIEACGTNAEGKVSLGYVDQLPQDDAEKEVAIECLPIIDSFDPNDKLVSPAGVTTTHYTPTGAELKYRIRFQNTGTDVAYKVVVVDTLSEHLDISTLTLGAVSHPYTMNVSGKGRPVLTFTFDNILLPDSNSNEPQSHGFINFNIKPKKELSEKTRVENFADIFFDFNEPVRTNTTLNSIYDVPPVVAEGSKLTEAVICHITHTTVAAGADKVICEKDMVILQATAPLQGKGRWHLIKGAGKIQERENPYTLVKELTQGETIFEWRVPANTCGTDSVKATVSIQRIAKPDTPAITQKGADSLFCSTEGDAYEWFLNGKAINQNAQTILAKEAGNYSVIVKNKQGCSSDLSASFAYVTTGIAAELAAQVLLYPNPGGGIFTLTLPASLARQTEVSVADALGRIFYSRKLSQGGALTHTQEIDISSSAAGVYVVKIQTPGGILIKKIFKK
jgi:uncharacterized repeat protein (TIGR01451 family)